MSPHAAPASKGWRRVAACRACDAPLTREFLDLGAMPNANHLLRRAFDREAEPHYPLRAMVCDACGWVQLDVSLDKSDLFADYAYFSSFSYSWHLHAKVFAETKMPAKFGAELPRVLEVASNDGSFLQPLKELGCEVLGVDPAENVARYASERGIPTRVAFFGERFARGLLKEGYRPKLIIANNVLAHVPDPRDFMAGVAALLGGGALASIEFPRLDRLVAETQFDTIYHEHFSYLSLLAVSRLAARCGIAPVDVERLGTHGGSFRVWMAAEADIRSGVRTVAASVDEARREETAVDPTGSESVAQFRRRSGKVIADLREFLEDAARKGAKVMGYGAAAKGNTMLNAVGATAAQMLAVADRNPEKIGRFLPGSAIPIVNPSRIFEIKPDYVLILPWNLGAEIMGSLTQIREWGGRFVIAVPELRVL